MAGEVGAMYHCTNCDNVEAKEREVVCWKCGKGEMAYLDLRPLKEFPDLRGAHYINIVIRQDGKDVVKEADWLKPLVAAVQSLKAIQ